MAQKDFPELEKECITYYNGEKHYSAIIAGCNFDIGVSIIDENDHDKYLLCFQGPSCNITKNNTYTIEQWSFIFYTLIHRIKNKYVNSVDLIKMVNKVIDGSNANRNPTYNDCPFG